MSDAADDLNAATLTTADLRTHLDKAANSRSADTAVQQSKKKRKKKAQDYGYPSLLAYLTRAPVNTFAFFLLYLGTQLEVRRQESVQSLQAMKQDMNSSCASLETMATEIALLPNEIAIRSNVVLNKLAPASVGYAVELMQVTIELTRQVILHIVNSQTTLIRCLIAAIYQGTSAALLSVVYQLQSEWNGIVNTVASRIDALITDINNELLKDIGDQFNQIFGTSVSTKVPVPDVAAIAGSIQISDSMTRDFANAIQSLPTPDQLWAQLENLITAPFVQAQNAVSGGVAALNMGTQPFGAVPTRQRTQVAFCDQHMPYSTMDQLTTQVSTAYTYALYAVGTALAGAVLWHAVRECLARSTLQQQVTTVQGLLKRQQRRSSETNSRAGRDPAPDIPAIDVVYAIRYPRLIRLLRRVRSTSLRRLGRWCLIYCAHPPSLVCLASGGVSLLLVMLQRQVIRAIEQAVPQQIAAGVNSTANNAVLSLNAQLAASSLLYATASNSVARNIENGFNSVFYDSFMNVASSVNATTTLVSSQLSDMINTTFSAVPLLEAGVSQLVSCLVTSKLDALNSFLQSAAQDSKLSLPTISETFLLINATLLQPELDRFQYWLAGSAAVSASPSDGSSSQSNATYSGGLLGRYLSAYKARLDQEQLWAVRLMLFGSSVFGMAFVNVLLQGALRVGRQLLARYRPEGQIKDGVSYTSWRARIRTRTEGVWHWYRSNLEVPRQRSRLRTVSRRVLGCTLAIIALPVACVLSILRWQNIFATHQQSPLSTLQLQKLSSTAELLGPTRSTASLEAPGPSPEGRSHGASAGSPKHSLMHRAIVNQHSARHPAAAKGANKTKATNSSKSVAQQLRVISTSSSSTSPPP
ncbi:plasma membrane fusion protein prm1 [Sorochytrium milnesiophthora]